MRAWAWDKPLIGGAFHPEGGVLAVLGHGATPCQEQSEVVLGYGKTLFGGAVQEGSARFFVVQYALALHIHEAEVATGGGEVVVHRHAEPIGCDAVVLLDPGTGFIHPTQQVLGLGHVLSAGGGQVLERLVRVLLEPLVLGST